MKILITGANGLLGQKLIRLITSIPGFTVAATSRGDQRFNINQSLQYYNLDVTERESVLNCFEETMPNVVINCAAMTNVDACETNKDECFALNVEAVKNLVDSIERFSPDTKLIQVSTDFVFDGTSSLPTEEDLPNPINFYGMSKLQSENLILENNLRNFAIVRTNLLFGKAENLTRGHIVDWIWNSLMHNYEIKLVDDQTNCPTWADDLAYGILKVVENDAQGIYNLAGPDLLSPYEMAINIAKEFDFNEKLISKITTKELNQKAKRPPYTGLDISKARRDLQYRPSAFIEAVRQDYQR